MLNHKYFGIIIQLILLNKVYYKGTESPNLYYSLKFTENNGLNEVRIIELINDSQKRGPEEIIKCIIFEN